MKILRQPFLFSLLLSGCLLAACQSGYTLKNPYLPSEIKTDSLGPKYLHNVSQIKYYDRISTSNTATGFAWWDSTGVAHELSEYYNKVILLNFFGTWSPPCLDQLKEIQQFQQMTDTNVLVIGVTQKETLQAGQAVVMIDSFARVHGINYQLLIGSRDFGFTYGGIDVVPTTFIITRRRKINSTFEGIVNAAALKDAVAKAEAKP